MEDLRESGDDFSEQTEGLNLGLEVVLLGEATELTKGDWGMWPEFTGEMAR